MILNLIFGIGLIMIGAFMSGSFAIPFSKTKSWIWENYWLAFSLFAYVVLPILCCYAFCPNFIEVLSNQPSEKLWWIFFLGFIYGLANLSFGLSLKFLGLSLGYSISLGLMMVLGTIIPPIIDGRLTKFLGQGNGELLIVGLCVAVLGVLISAYAGYKKEKALGSSENKDFNFTKGILAAIFVGVAGSALSLAIEQGNEITTELLENGVNPLFQIVPVYLVIYGGSFIATLIWCLYVSHKKKVLKAFVSTPKPAKLSLNYLYCFIAGFLWFVSFVFFGMGKSRMGEFSFTAWGILMSLTIAFATVWGLYRNEWKGVDKKTKFFMYLGLVTLIASAFIIGISGE